MSEFKLGAREEEWELEPRYPISEMDTGKQGRPMQQ